jgi:5-methylthioadenosine/S-adenosylhomocysteine deaminase
VPSLLIRNATVLTMNDTLDIVDGAVSVRDGRIVSVGPETDAPHDRVVDAGGDWLLPGFVQTHVHLCQTLFRGYADDLRLLDWLKRRVWPMEAAHTAASLRAAARLAAAELLRTGTTAVLTMETVHETEAVCEIVEASGLRATIGKCMMDADDAVPRRLRETTRQSIDESLALRRAWDGASGGRIRIALAPRFAVSCSRPLLEAVAALAGEHDCLVHTHASESRGEIALVRERTGMDNVPYLAETGLASHRLCAAHCIWVDDAAQALIAERQIRVLHCPGSNLKLGSGLAPVAELRARGVSVSLGADGAACNNRLDMFEEMRLAALIQAVRREPGALAARDVVLMATREGARALGLSADIGSIEAGKRADLILVGRTAPHLAPGTDPYSTLVYAARGTDVRMTMVDGHVLVDQGALVREDPLEVADVSRREAQALARRAGIA